MCRNVLLSFALLILLSAAQAQEHTIELVADKDSRYKLAGKADPVVRLVAGEPVLLRITAHRAKTWNRDGSIHGFALLRSDGSKVDGWNLLLKEGANEFRLTAPAEAGEYKVVCTVICSMRHEQMHMKVIVAN
jgi:heme/copper-type cytochrome/quinol oxidase subunit 2